MQLQPDCAPTHLVCVQEFFSPVLHDVVFALQEAHTWVINGVNFFDHPLGSMGFKNSVVVSVQLRKCMHFLQVQIYWMRFMF